MVEATERIVGMGGSSGHNEGAEARLRAAWLRRDVDALHHLFAYCEIPSIALSRRKRLFNREAVLYWLVQRQSGDL